MRPCRPLLLMCALSLLVGCPSGHTQGAQSSASKPSAESAPSADAALLLYGDSALKERLRQALAAKGPSYVPRTKHLDAQGQPKYTNRLITQSSPYLQQHAHNPVNWFPWGDEAFAVAAQLNRPVFLSVGYSTCHWCHVMEEESFEDEAIAQYLNDNYICIKVDREERPDVDAVYMRSVQLLTRRGGWPMSVWLTHDRKPFYGGTYFPARDGDRGVPKGFLTLLREQRALFSAEPKTIAEDAERLARRIQSDMQPPPGGHLPAADALLQAVKFASQRYDSVHGGARGRPKFPSSFPIRLLLRHGHRAHDEQSISMALTTLRKMAAGGIYDQVGGGFHRYSVDERWLVPHFEKMLYDNALLASAYIEGHQQSADPELSRIAREILSYVMREMTSPEGGYYSATDADSLTPTGQREEGYYFTWTEAELNQALGTERAKIVSAYYAVTAKGNFEGRSIFTTPRSRAEVAAQLKIDEKALSATIAEALPLLRTARDKRPKPLLDDKIQVSWNGLMLSAMAKGALVFDDAGYRDNAVKAASFLLDKLRVKGRLMHSYKDGRTSTVAFAEDYAFLIGGLLDVFELTGEPHWLDQAIALSRQLDVFHESKETGGYYRTASDHEALLAREIETRDGAIPCAGSVAVLNHLRLLSLTARDEWRIRAETTLRAYATTLGEQPWALDEMMLALDYLTDSPKEVLIVVPTSADTHDADALRAVLSSTFGPNRVAIRGAANELPKALGSQVPWVVDKPPRGGKATAYVCEHGACELPTRDPRVFRKQLLAVQPYPGVGAP